ncbi:hypothetical protein [Streptosporangium carneum]|uniref:Uncharacterized protein n=1 Tax=Streptosporangium carneum TaxID=47481 RepID=A0A9W6MEE7_9ACTN|nr:hypothetical protein [Streptosporangium carneum]GLK10783.1 hypothetical protein GCM10017600_41890 [Streptosporangium carneum]
MKRLIGGVSVAAAAALAFAPAAQASSTGGAETAQSRGVPSMGVRFTDLSAVTEDGGSTPLVRRTGSFQFGKDGVAASDISSKPAAKAGDRPAWVGDRFAPQRTIRIGVTSYVSGGSYGARLPKGKTWYRTDKDVVDAGAWFGQIVNTAEPATLGTLLRHAKRSGGVYSGTVTFAELAEVSHWFRTTLPIRASDKTAVTFRLTLDRDRHPRRLTTSWRATGVFDSDDWEGRTINVETRFAGWGGRVTVKAPPASKVSTTLRDETEQH